MHSSVESAAPLLAVTTSRGEAAAIDRAVRLIEVPRATASTSFTLHAPLELVARVGLLPLVRADRRGDAVSMIEWITDQFESAGDPVLPPARVAAGSPMALAAALLLAIDDGDLDAVDAHATALLATVSAGEAVGLLGEPLVTSLAAAGHAPIGFMLLGRVRPALSPLLLRGALRSIATAPDWRLRWHRGARAAGDPGGLHAALRAVPHIGPPGSDYIFPLMSQVQDNGLAERVLAPVLADRYDTQAASHVLTRIAAWSMIHDDQEQAPYGWTHALTMPQAVMALAGAGVHARTALAVAGTFQVGFRAAHGTATLPEVIEPGPAPDATWEDLATAAALHEDAHLVKFTLASRYAAADDPAYADLYRNAAARLVEWWLQRRPA